MQYVIIAFGIYVSEPARQILDSALVFDVSNVTVEFGEKKVRRTCLGS